MDVADLAERIIHDINVVFRREAHLDEFDIIPVLESQNKSPVIHVNTKIALESWCVKLLYLHVYNSLMEWRERRLKANGNSACSWSEVLLLLNPDVTTAWNIRKELFASGKLTVHDELRLCLLILTRKPKSPEVFIHRRWLIDHLLPRWPTFDKSYKDQLVADEMHLCTIGAARYANNYCAWSHRQWVHSTLTIKYLDRQVLFDELKWNETYIQQHVSDHSGLHFRQFLLKAIIGSPTERTLSPFSKQESCLCKSGDAEGTSQETRNHDCVSAGRTIGNLLFLELSMIRSLIRDFVGHEALWYHSRFVIHTLHAIKSNNRESSINVTGPIVKKTRTESAPTETAPSCKSEVCPAKEVEEELRFTDEILTENPLEHFAARHKRWLLHFFELDQ